MSAWALGLLFLVLALPGVGPESRVAFVEAGVAEVLDPRWGWHLAVLGGGGIVAVLALWPALRRDRAWLALPWVLLVPLLLLGAPSLEDLRALALAMTP